MNFLVKAFNKLKYWLLALLLLPFCAWSVNAADDLMRQVMDPAIYGWTTMDLWESVNRVWKNVLEWKSTVSVDGEGIHWNKNGPSIIVRLTRVLLSLVVALSITMILYNWLSYIIQTWQWKEGKNLVKNVVYIVIWILVSLFSVTIITILQSVSTTLDKDTTKDRNLSVDERLVNWEKTAVRWPQIFGHNTLF